jgi:hypothetical protein
VTPLQITRFEGVSQRQRAGCTTSGCISYRIRLRRDVSLPGRVGRGRSARAWCRRG